MLPTTVLNRFLERCPAAVMVRATLERLLEPKRLDRIFEESRQRQYSKKLLFSQLVALMAAVATRTCRSVHAAYLAMQKQLGVSPAAVYEKLNHVEPETTASLVRETAADAARVIETLPAAKKEILPARGLLPRRQPSRGRRASYRRTSPHERGSVAGAVLGASGRAAGVDRRNGAVRRRPLAGTIALAAALVAHQSRNRRRRRPQFLHNALPFRPGGARRRSLRSGSTRRL